MPLDLKLSQDEVLRRVGRNLVIFQQIEGFLKFLVANHKGDSSPGAYIARQQKRTELINKQMLGNLVDMYGTEVLRDAGLEVSEEENPETPWMSFSFRVTGDTEFLETRRRDLKLMTEQRNELVHGFLPRWQPDSPDKLKEALEYLDAQREKVLPMHEHLRNTVNQMQEGGKAFIEFMASEAFQHQFELMWLQGSSLVALLRDVTTQIHRKDGWTYLAHAGRLATKKLPEEVEQIKERYGHNTLKKLLIACEIFEVVDEPLANGGFRTIYRMRPGSE